MRCRNRTKFERLTARSNPSRQEVINLLIDDRLKVFIAKRYGLEVSESEIDQAVQTMAGRMRVTPEQLGGSLAQQGISINALRSKVRADIAWSQIVRGRYNPALRVDDAEINNAMRARGVRRVAVLALVKRRSELARHFAVRPIALMPTATSPAGVELSALPTRLMSTCESRPGSPR